VLLSLSALPFVLALAVVTGAAGLDDDPRFREGTASFRALEYERALAAFDALARDPKLNDADDDSARVLLWVGATRALLGDELAARLAFEGALRRDRDATFEMRVSSKVVALLEDVRQHLPAPPPPPPPPELPRDAPVVEPARDPPRVEPKEAPLAKLEPEERTVEPVEAQGVSPWVTGAVVTGALAVIAAVPASLLVLDAFARQARAEDPSTSQQQAAELNQAANESLAGAVAVGVVSVGLGVAAAVTGAIALSDDDDGGDDDDAGAAAAVDAGEP
jgi:hypothetical protein